MIKICGQSIFYTLKLILTDSLQEVIFPKSWKKANFVAVHKKGCKTLIKNFRPSCPLPIFGKFFEWLIANELFIHLPKRNFLQNLKQIFCIRWLMHLSITFYSAWDKFIIWLYTKCWWKRSLSENILSVW